MNNENGAPAVRPHGSARPGYSLDVRLWKVTKVNRKARPYQLRWVVGGKVSSATFATSALPRADAPSCGRPCDAAKPLRSRADSLSPRSARRR